LLGKVKWFNEIRGYGLIRVESDGREIPVSYNDIVTDGFRTLHEGELVEFDIDPSFGCGRAVNVRKTERY